MELIMEHGHMVWTYLYIEDLIHQVSQEFPDNSKRSTLKDEQGRMR